MSIVDSTRIKQNWDPEGKKGGYKIDYHYDGPDASADPEQTRIDRTRSAGRSAAG